MLVKVSTVSIDTDSTPLEARGSTDLRALHRSLRTCARGGEWLAVTIVVEDPAGIRVLTWPAAAIRDLDVAAAPGREALASGAVVVRRVGPDEHGHLGIDRRVRSCLAVEIDTGRDDLRAAATAWSAEPATPALVAEAETLGDLLQGPVRRIAREQGPWEQYRRLGPELAELPVGIVALDDSGVVRFWSARAAELLGVGVSRAQGASLSMLDAPFSPTLRSSPEIFRARVRAAANPVVETSTGLDGARLVWTLSPGPDGQGVVAFLHPEEQPVEASALQPCGALAHELNNVLTAILLNAELLGAALPSEGQSGAYVRRLLGSTERAASLGTLLMMASACQGGSTERIDAAMVVDDAVAVVRGELPPGVEVELLVGGGALNVLADERQLALAVDALLTNAREALGDSGELSVRVEGVDHGPPGGDRVEHVRITVKDSGRGMSPAVLERCTLPFVTTHPARLGLGLAAVKGLADVAKGALVLRSATGTGTRAELWMPRV